MLRLFFYVFSVITGKLKYLMSFISETKSLEIWKERKRCGNWETKFLYSFVRLNWLVPIEGRATKTIFQNQRMNRLLVYLQVIGLSLNVKLNTLVFFSLSWIKEFRTSSVNWLSIDDREIADRVKKLQMKIEMGNKCKSKLISWRKSIIKRIDRPKNAFEIYKFRKLWHHTGVRIYVTSSMRFFKSK